MQHSATARSRQLGLLAMCIAVVCFSLGSTLIRKAAAPGPAGALLFKDRINTRALLFGLIPFAGLAIVLFNAEKRGDAS